MDVDDDGPAAGEPNRGLVEEPGDRAPVEARPVNQLRLREVRRIEAAGLALDPAHQPAGHEVERIRVRSEEHTSELQSRSDLVCRLLLEKKKKNNTTLSSK